MYKLISPQIIFQYFGEDDQEMLREMIQIIMETNLTDLKHLQNFYSESDYEMIKKKCHKAKPSMSYVGALQTRKVLEEIEEDLENSEEKYKILLNQISIIDAELEQFLKEL
jgi:hypothetical protein